VIIKSTLLILSFCVLVSCLKTRSELGESYQSHVYGHSQTQNQKDEANKNSLQEPVENSVKVDEKDELIRNLNGRIESLENQINQLNKEKATNTDSQKVQLLQDTLIKMEAQMAKLEQEMAARQASDDHERELKRQADAAAKENAKKTDKNLTKTPSKKNAAFEIAQEFFAQKDFKNAILEYQKFTDSNPKSKYVAEAKYKIGLSFEAMGLKDEAYSFYEEVAAQYGSSDFGQKAKQKISKKKKK